MPAIFNLQSPRRAHNRLCARLRSLRSLRLLLRKIRAHKFRLNETYMLDRAHKFYVRGLCGLSLTVY